MQAFKDGDIRFLICTDVAARGIDISGLPYLINMTLPDRSEDYIHRVGRVGTLSGASVFSPTSQSTSLLLKTFGANTLEFSYCQQKVYCLWVSCLQIIFL